MKSVLYTTSLFFILHICTTATGQEGIQSQFWQSLQQLCGKAFAGVVVAAPETDTVFAGRALVMHVRACEADRIRILLVVGEDRSRTWILTNSPDAITLKHDHRHEDGSEDTITQYGGTTSNSGSAEFQMFPADQFTAGLLPPAAGNVWWIEVDPGVSFTYNLRRIGTDRYFSMRFDLTQEVLPPAAPWGWKD